MVVKSESISGGSSRQPWVCPNPVFVIGSHRSGTTALAAALARHSHFWASDESFFIYSMFGEGRIDQEYQRWHSRPSGSWLRTQKVGREEFLASVGLGVNALFSSRSQGKRWIDHTPHHALMADALAQMFPGAYFLHILRDGRLVVNSMINVSRTLSESDREQMQKNHFLPKWATNFRHACRSWRQQAEAASDFCLKNPQRGLTIPHEQIERDPSNILRGVLEFVQAPHEEGPAEYLATNRINSSFGPSARNQSAMARPHKPWEVWTAEQKHIFAKEAGPTLIRLGFASPQELAAMELKEVPHQTSAPNTPDEKISTDSNAVV